MKKTLLLSLLGAVLALSGCSAGKGKDNTFYCENFYLKNEGKYGLLDHKMYSSISSKYVVGDTIEYIQEDLSGLRNETRTYDIISEKDGVILAEDQSNGYAHKFYVDKKNHIIERYHDSVEDEDIANGLKTAYGACFGKKKSSNPDIVSVIEKMKKADENPGRVLKYAEYSYSNRGDYSVEDATILFYPDLKLVALLAEEYIDIFELNGEKDLFYGNMFDYSVTVNLYEDEDGESLLEFHSLSYASRKLIEQEAAYGVRYRLLEEDPITNNRN